MPGCRALALGLCKVGGMWRAFAPFIHCLIKLGFCSAGNFLTWTPPCGCFTADWALVRFEFCRLDIWGCLLLSCV